MNKSELDISNLKKCIESLQNCVKDFQNTTELSIKEYIEDACVKRFEYTVETSWKIMKKYLKLEYGKNEKELTMNNIFRFMEGYGLIKSWEKGRYYYDKRNDTSHEYNKEKANEILTIINDLTEDAQFLYNQLNDALGE
jgi:nucleotidyltransferase substrate binding protein (TIGR01987 family)